MTPLLDRLIGALAYIAALLLCTLTVLICLDVLVRYGQWFSMRWTLDIAEYHLYLITFLAAPWVLLNGGHIAVDLLVQRVGPSIAALLTRTAHVIGTVVCAVLLYYSIKVLMASFTAGTLIYKALIMPEWPLFLAPPLTFGLMLIIFLRWLLKPSREEAAGIEMDGL